MDQSRNFHHDNVTRPKIILKMDQEEKAIKLGDSFQSLLNFEEIIATTLRFSLSLSKDYAIKFGAKSRHV